MTAEQRAASWRRDNAVSDAEFYDIGGLLCDYDPRDLALMIVRLQAAINPVSKADLAILAERCGGDHAAYGTDQHIAALASNLAPFCRD